MQPSDSLASFGRGFGSPCQRPTSWDRRLFCRLSRRPARAPANALASEMDYRLSVRPETPEERQGPPGLLGRPLPACRGATPRRTRPSPRPYFPWEDPRRGRHRLHGKQNARHPEWHSFRGHVPTAHTLACLRFAGPVTDDRRKARYRLGRAHPWPGGIRTRWTTNRNFMESSHPPIPIDQQGLVALSSYPPEAPFEPRAGTDRLVSRHAGWVDTPSLYFVSVGWRTVYTCGTGYRLPTRVPQQNRETSERAKTSRWVTSPTAAGRRQRHGRKR